MFLGPRDILTGVNIEHGANASPRQDSVIRREFALFARLHFQLNLVSRVLANALTTTGFGDEK